MPTKSSPLQRQQRGSSGLLALVVVLGEDQPLDELAAVAEEHVLGAAQADALGAEAAGPRGVLGGVGVGAHPQPAPLVGVAMIRCTACDQVVGAPAASGSSLPSKYSTTGDGTTGTSPR